MTALAPSALPDFAAARFHMVECQIRPNKVTDLRILDTMGVVPREMFVPKAAQGIAYIDEDLALGNGRYLTEPMVLARMLQEAGIKATDRVLDIACATGYSTAVIAALAAEVIAVEADKELAASAAGNLAALNIHNAEVKAGPLPLGASSAAPFDVIIVNGGMETPPEALLLQLAEGGRLVGVARRYGPAHAAHLGEARLYEKLRGAISQRPLFDANVKLLPGFAAKPVFVF